MPRWAIQPFRDFLNHTQEVVQLAHVSARGLAMLRGAPELMEAVQKAEADEIELSEGDRNISSEDAAKRLEQVREEAKLARQEVDKGFPLLYSPTLVSLWSSLEDLMHTFLAAWVTHTPGAKQAEALQKLKVKLSEYEALDEEEKGFYIVELLEREGRSPLKQGASRFEHLLDSFDLAGAVDSDVRESLFEMNHIRNVLVHRRGVVDKRFVDACPHLGFSIGDSVSVDRRSFDRYSNSVAKYVLQVFSRVRDCFDATAADEGEVIEDIE